MQFSRTWVYFTYFFIKLVVLCTFFEIESEKTISRKNFQDCVFAFNFEMEWVIELTT